MGKRLILCFLCCLVGCSFVQTCSVLDANTGKPLSPEAENNRIDISETHSSGVVARFKFSEGTGSVFSDSNSYCGIGCSSVGLFSYVQNGDVYEVSYNKEIFNANFFDSDSSYFVDQPAYTLPFVCFDEGTYVALFYVIDANNNVPEFNTNGGSVNIKIPYSAKALDSLMPYYSEIVWATDTDADLETNGKISFETDRPDSFLVVPKETTAHGKRMFLPDIILQKDASLFDPAPTALVLTAKDFGVPQMSSTLTFTITVETPDNLYPPVFSEPVYSFKISTVDFSGPLGTVVAVDGDGLRGISYEILDYQGLSLSIDNSGSITLVDPVPTNKLEEKALIILVKAVENADGLSPELKEAVVPFVLILPDPEITTTTQTTQSTTPCECTTVTITECPTVTVTECPTQTITECPIQTTTECPETTCPTCPIVTESSCPPCPIETTLLPSTCPTPEQPTGCPQCPETTLAPITCPNTGPPTECPQCPELTTILSTLCPQTECTTSPVDVTTCPTTTCECPTTCPTTVASSSEPCPTSTSCPECPIATVTSAPELTTTKCPLDCSQCPTTSTECPSTCPTTSTAPTTCECPLTCPSLPTCPPSSNTTSCPLECPECPTTTVPLTCPVVTCPTCEPWSTGTTTTTGRTTTTASGGSCPPCVCTTTTEAPTTPAPVVEFERQQYSAEVIEQVQGYNILTVRATHSEGLAVTYGLDIGSNNPAIGKFAINAQGVIRTVAPLPSTPKNYLFQVSAFADGISDSAPVYIEVIPGVNCGEPLFQEVLFVSNLKENTKQSDFVQVFVANPTNVDYQIAGVFPDTYRNAFSINSTTGYISCVETIDYERQDEIRITVEARTKSMQRRADYSLATALVKMEDLNDNKPVFVDPPKILAYPSAAMDESVPMPLAKFSATDADSGINAEVTYLVNSPLFYMDENDGILFAKSSAKTCGNAGCTVTVVATDKGTPPLSSDPVSVQVKFISDEYISLFITKAVGNSLLTPSQVVQLISSKLGYEIGLLSASPQDGSLERFAANEITLSVFATQNDELVTRSQFKKDFDAVASSITEFEKKGEIRQPNHGDQSTAGSDDLLAATIALSIVLGLVIIGASVGFLYLFKGDALRRGSSRSRLQSEGEESTSSGEASVAIMPRINEKEFRASPLPDKNAKQLFSVVPPIIPEVKSESKKPSLIISDDIEVPGETSSDPPTIQVTDLDQDYTPDSPKPVKSAIKNSMLEDEDEKEKKGGVRFDAEPEVFEIPLRTESSNGLESDLL